MLNPIVGTQPIPLPRPILRENRRMREPTIVNQNVPGQIDRLRNGPPGLDDVQVWEATRPHPGDNPDGAALKRDYREAFDRAQEGRAWAEQTAAQYSPGVHQLPDGEVVSVRYNPDMSTTVIRREADGSERRIDYDPDDPSWEKLTQRDAEGRKVVTSRRGTGVTVDRDGSGEIYTIGDGSPGFPGLFEAPRRDAGNPHRVSFQGDFWTGTEVNRDGSTDTRTWDSLIHEVREGHKPGNDFLPRPVGGFQ